MAFLQQTYRKRKKASCPGQQHPVALISDGKSRAAGIALRKLESWTQSSPRAPETREDAAEVAAATALADSRVRIQSCWLESA